MMFTGIIEELGTIRAIDVHGDHAELDIGAREVTRDAAIGDSVAVDGCCLTIARLHPDGFTADLMAETMHATALGRLEVGDQVNLEAAMPASGRFGGHIVSGHVDAVGTIVERRDEPGTTWLGIRAPARVAAQLVAKGSITVAGVSLTVVDVTDDADETALFTVGLIPHTLKVTTFGRLAVGDEVNLEGDVLAKYVARLAQVSQRSIAGMSLPPAPATEAAP